jgi:hypothetical protein
MKLVSMNTAQMVQWFIYIIHLLKLHLKRRILKGQFWFKKSYGYFCFSSIILLILHMAMEDNSSTSSFLQHNYPFSMSCQIFPLFDIFKHLTEPSCSMFFFLSSNFKYNTFLDRLVFNLFFLHDYTAVIISLPVLTSPLSPKCYW